MNQCNYPINHSVSNSVIASGDKLKENDNVLHQEEIYWDLTKVHENPCYKGVRRFTITMEPTSSITKTSENNPKYYIQSRFNRCISLENSPHLCKSEISMTTADILPSPDIITEKESDEKLSLISRPVIFTTEKILPVRPKKCSSRSLTTLHDKNQTSSDALKSDLEKAESALKTYIHLLSVAASTKEDKIKLLAAILSSIERAWSLPSVGRDLAYKLCDVLRTNGGIDILLNVLSEIQHSRNKQLDRDLLLSSANVLSQSMTVPNREYVANCQNGLDTIVAAADYFKDDKDVSKAALGIMECLFKHTKHTCKRLLQIGGLDSVLYACRYFDASVLRHCAVSLANLALYGDEDCQQFMIIRNAPEWLFPLAFSEDDGVKYYAFLAIATLGANKSLEQAVTKSGTLKLIEPFLRNRDPVEFGTSDRAHMHGHSIEWLAKLVPLLSSKRAEVQSLAAFHFAMEAAIRDRQGKLEIFKEIDVIESLKRLSRASSTLASKFSNKALEILGVIPLNGLYPQVMLWTTEEICEWMTQNNQEEDIIQRFRKDKVDADLLLQLTDEELRRDFKLDRSIDRRRFFRDLNKLKQIAIYDACDVVSPGLDEFLKSIGPDFRQYYYQMSRAGVDISIIKSLTDEHLALDCGITNGIHRMKILEAAKKTSSFATPPYLMDYKLFDKNLDVFISYRRSNGSQLASLLKVHLQLRGFSVFLDIEKLTAGKFDEGLVMSIQSSKNFILVLTPNALDRCIGDTDCKDWVHKEVVAALNGNCNIIPIIDDFQYPPSESLPDDIKHISCFNGIRWIHDYQDACVDKLEQFITGNVPSKRTANYPRNPLSKVGSACSEVFQPNFEMSSDSKTSLTNDECRPAESSID